MQHEQLHQQRLRLHRPIHCTVNSCAHHCKNEQYCGLDTIQVGTHEANPTMDQCTDCQSFKLMQ